MTSRLSSILTAAILAAGAACSSPSAPTPPAAAPIVDVGLTPVAQSAEWAVATPADSGVDPARLTDLLNRIRRREFGNIDSLLVVRRERLIMEEYFNAGALNTPHTLQSVTKSVTSLAAGLAVDRGLMRVSDPVLPMFPDYQPVAALDANKQAMTIRDLLTMRTGYDWTEHNYATSPLARLNTCFCDWIRFVLDHRMSEPPGSRFEYNSGGVILLAAAIGRATGSRLDQFLQSELFGPMGFQGVQWDRGQPLALPHAGGGLYLRSRDMAKLGSLMAMRGRWQGRQLISAAWLRESVQMTNVYPIGWGGQPTDYGYLWWGFPNVIAASGSGGQWILAVPDKELAVISTASDDGSHFDAAVRMLFEVILPVVE
jgi:CubicO group peptidase (beta-lactamase class C family)